MNGSRRSGLLSSASRLIARGSVALLACTALAGAESGRQPADAQEPAGAREPAGAQTSAAATGPSWEVGSLSSSPLLLAPNGRNLATSTNWSGYISMGGPYRSVTGTFTVPYITQYVSGSTISEWVGIDGYTSGSLIQAGINEIPEGQGQWVVEPWWEVWPSPQRLATGMMVRSGQSVTVTLRHVSNERWGITLTDDTNGDAFNTEQEYKGMLSSADWVVEANAQDNGNPTQLAPFSQLSFSHLAAAGTETRLTCLVMVQRDQAVSTPSALWSGGFDVVDGAATATGQMGHVPLPAQPPSSAGGA
jgi:Peptidase A4 family